MFVNKLQSSYSTLVVLLLKNTQILFQKDSIILLCYKDLILPAIIYPFISFLGLNAFKCDILSFKLYCAVNKVGYE